MSDSESSEDEQLWEVEKIVDHRDVDEDGNKVEVEYRVRWVGFPSGNYWYYSNDFLTFKKRRRHMGAAG